MAVADEKIGHWGVVLGAAAISPDFNEGRIGGTAEIDYFASETVTFALRHAGDYEDNGNDTSINLTRIGFDWTPGSRTSFEPFGGFSLGWAFGESINESGLAGAHIGLRCWQQPNAFLQAVAGYDRFCTRTEDETEVYRDTAITWLVGIGILF